MKKAEFEKMMDIWGDAFEENTCYELSLEIVKKIVKCKAPDFNKMNMVSQYMKNLVTNSCMVEAINQYNK